MIRSLRALRMRRRMAVLASFLGTAAGLVAGELRWEQTTVAQDVLPTDKKAEAVFRFTNTSPDTVEIRSVKTSCGCTTAELPKKIFGPGESGSVTALFRFGGRKGRQQKTILVQTSEKGKPPDVLTMRVNIPEAFVFDQESLNWRVGDPPSAQAIEVVVVDPSQARIKAVRPLGKNFTATLEEVEGGKRYRIVVGPLTTAEPAKGTIRVDVADPGDRAIYFPVAVKK